MSFDAFRKPRPTPRGLDVTTTLRDFALITYAVEPERLAALLPPGFEPEIVRLDDGTQRALVSAVPFRDEGFRFAAFPWLRLSFPQTNYRAYIRHGTERAVWFFGTTLGTRWVYWPRYVWQLPWHRARYNFQTLWRDESCESFALKIEGAWGGAETKLAGTGEKLGRLDGFADADETAGILTHPLVGYYRTRRGKLGTYSVWHDRIPLQKAEVAHARFEVFERLGLVQPGEKPHSALLAKETEFIIRLPPQLLPGTPFLPAQSTT